ncbi:MAG: transposase [Thermoleophilaceae bacterium]|nr:transposase [Thermoleophilaceae bacterium]
MPHQPPSKRYEDLPPSMRYLRKDYTPDSTFHVYNRGRHRQLIFLDDHDRRAFLACFSRQLVATGDIQSEGRSVKSLENEVSVISYCLMPNHFHLLIHQSTQFGLKHLMRSAMISYGMYFNHRHGRIGRLFVDRFKAVKVTSPKQLRSTIAYIHLNPETPFDDRWTSHRLYMRGDRERDGNWCAVDQGIRAFGGRGAYLEEMHAKLAKREQGRPEL